MPDSYSFAPSYDQPNPRERKMPNWKLQDHELIWDADAPDPEPDADEQYDPDPNAQFTPTGDEDDVEPDDGFDPADHNIDDVKAWVEDNPDYAPDVLEAEQAGKNRVTLVEWLAAFEG